ncbi:MAG: hypothetical protein TREMPRED_001888, partial [Tremellales sp. Tagirdzhanova-0007]
MGVSPYCEAFREGGIKTERYQMVPLTPVELITTNASYSTQSASSRAQPNYQRRPIA